MKKTSILSIICLLIIQISFAQQYSASFTDIKEIQLTTGSGDCDIKRSSGNTITVTLDHEMGSDYAPDIDQRGDKLVLKDGDNKIKGEYHWTLQIPDNLEMKLISGSGDLTINGLSIELNMTTGSGDIILEDVNGDIRSNTGSGEIRLTDFDGELRANTGSGGADVKRSAGKININSGSGDIIIAESSAAINANVGSGDIDVTGFVATGKSAYNSGSGDVLVVLAATPEYDLSLNSGSGDSTLDRNGNSLNGQVVMSANQERGEISAPFEFDRQEVEERGSNKVMKKYATVGSGGDVKISIGTGSGTAKIK